MDISTDLDASTWMTIARTWQALSEVPPAEPDTALERLWSGLQSLVEFDACYVVLAQRTQRTRRAYLRGYVNGWLFAEFFYGPGDWEPVYQEGFADDWHERLAEDPWLVRLTEGAGSHRTLLREDFFSDEEWQEYLRTSQSSLIGTTERLNSVYSIDDDAEVYLGFLRRGAQRFDERDRAASHVLHLGLGPLWRRLSMSYGLLAFQNVLSPRGRETLLLLLAGLSEPEIAEHMELTRGTIHQYVVNVFRSMNVNSRAELMARWMGM